MDSFLKILAALALVALNGFFVAAEFASVGARASRLETEEQPHGLLDKLALEIKRRLDLYLSSCQLGVTLASLGLGAIIEPTVAALLEPLLHTLNIPHHDISVISFAIALAISSAFHIVIGEQVPKNWAIRYADRVLPHLALPLVIFTYLFYPAIALLNIVTNAVLALVGVNVEKAPGGLPHTHEELRGLIAQAVKHGTLAKGPGSILTSAFDFGDLKVRQIMTPRTEVTFLLLNQPTGEILRTIQKAAYTRMPLCDGDIDHVIGLVNMKDLFVHLKLVPGKLKFIDERTPDGEVIAIPTGLPGSQLHVIGSGEINLLQIKREILFIPELTPVPKLLRQFQTSHIHMAVVVDEYGATKGVVTLEDVIEQIVGEIEDEFDAAAPPEFVKEGESFRVSGLYPLHELRENLALSDLDVEGVDTLGGYLIKELGRWPKPGDVVPLGDYTTRVLSVQGKRIGRVLITPTTQQTARADGPGESA